MKIEDFKPEVLDDFLMNTSSMLFAAEAALERMRGEKNKASQLKFIESIKHGQEFVLFNRRELGI